MLIIPGNKIVGVAVAMVIEEKLFPQAIILDLGFASNDDIWFPTPTILEIQTIRTVVGEVTFLELSSMTKLQQILL